MLRLFLTPILLWSASMQVLAGDVPALPAKYESTADRILQAARSSDFAYRRLAELCDTFGPRFSGTPELERAIDWVLAELKRDGFANVRGEDVLVPRWVRGREHVELLEPRRSSLPMLGLGGSVGTPKEGITAPVLVVDSFEDLRSKANEAVGKIVLFDVPFTDYRETVLIRVNGAIEAAKAGAVASLIRSVGPFSMQTPHTGGMSYDPLVNRIPHAAITLEDSMMLRRMQDRGQNPIIRLTMEATTLPDAVSRNVIAELPGTESPDEIVLVSGHIDSWDVGTGAMDDGGGCLAAWEAVRVLMNLKLQPRRTIRLVLWTNEENGLRGAKTYARTHAEELPNHLIGIESDAGAFPPTGFGFTGSEKAMPYLESIGRLLEPISKAKIAWGCRGADVMQLLSGGVPAMHLEVSRERYFWFHHTHADTIDKLSMTELQDCVAYMATMAFAIADMPTRLPR